MVVGLDESEPDADALVLDVADVLDVAEVEAMAADEELALGVAVGVGVEVLEDAGELLLGADDVLGVAVLVVETGELGEEAGLEAVVAVCVLGDGVTAGWVAGAVVVPGAPWRVGVANGIPVVPSVPGSWVSDASAAMEAADVPG